MQTKTFRTSSSIRFRRWSRVGYAVFSSLVCNVTIGMLSVSVSDKTLQKAVGKSSFSFLVINSESISPEKMKEQADLELAIQQLQEITLLEKTFKNAAACGLNINIFIKSNG